MNVRVHSLAASSQCELDSAWSHRHPRDAVDTRIFVKEEVLNMLLAEYDYETDIAVQRAEEREIVFAEGIENL